MQNGEVRLKRIGFALPENAVQTDWIENSRMIIACGKVIRTLMVASIFRAVDGTLYLKVAPDKPGDSELKLEAGVYFDVQKVARIANFESQVLRPGMNHISNIIRMCRTKNLQENNASIWTMRKKVLRGIFDLHKWLDVGIYQIIVDRPYLHSSDETNEVGIRRPDYASGRITDAEKQKLEEYIDSWMRRARRTEPIESEKLISAINHLYHCFGLKAPRIVIASSPLVVTIAGSFATALCYAKKNKSANADSSPNAFDALVSDEMYETTVQTAFHGIEDLVHATTEKMFERLMEDTYGREVRRSFHGSAGEAVASAVADAMEAAVSNGNAFAIGDQDEEFENDLAAAIFQATSIASDTKKLRHASHEKTAVTSSLLLERLATELSGGDENVRDLMLSCVSDCRKLMKSCNTQQYDECLTTALKEVLGLRLPRSEKFSTWQDVVTKCGAFVLHEEFCIISDFPQVCRIDEESRPHCTNGPSYVWKDSWKLYHWQGIRVTRQLIERPDTITVEDIKKEPNLEVRRLMLERYGFKNFLIDSDAKEIHRDECGVLYIQEIDPAFEPIVMVKVLNSTAEADGSRKEYFLRVPPHISTAKAAVAWTFGLTADEYSPLVQT
jgi:hypothetical protein